MQYHIKVVCYQAHQEYGSNQICCRRFFKDTAEKFKERRILETYTAIKWLIMDGFQILRCLWKCLGKTLQSIVSEFSEAKNLTKNRPPNVFESHVCQLQT